MYVYFPTLERLLLEATLGLLEDALDRTIRTLGELMADTLPLGGALIKLSVDRPTDCEASPSTNVPRRGYRRVEWIERAIDPLRARLNAEASRLLGPGC